MILPGYIEFCNITTACQYEPFEYLLFWRFYFHYFLPINHHRVNIVPKPIAARTISADMFTMMEEQRVAMNRELRS